MGSEDDKAYKKSVRNMSFVLAAIVITIFAALIIPPYVNPQHDNFQKSVSMSSAQGFTMNLKINSTSLSQSGRFNISAWVFSGSQPLNVTSASIWGVDATKLWGRNCTSGWPIGVGIMQGHYSQDNYTLGILIPLFIPKSGCPNVSYQPPWYAFAPRTSRALVTISGTPVYWSIVSTLNVGPGILGPAGLSGAGANHFPRGVYTVVAADEWGDVLTTNFRVL